MEYIIYKIYMYTFLLNVLSNITINELIKIQLHFLLLGIKTHIK